MTKEYSAFGGVNLSDARLENETREEYKERLKRNKKAFKVYKKVGREAFKEMFPEGIKYDMFETPDKEQVKKNAKKLGEAK